MKQLLVIDSGTTNSRIRLTDGHEVSVAASRAVGARDVAVTGSTEVLENALREAIDELLANADLQISDIEAIVASGMITSNMGLLEIPHLAAPSGLREVALGMVSRTFPAIVEKPILFIPGVKTGFGGESDLMLKDMMRGEEAEIFGYLDHIGHSRNESLIFMHYGSHHKGILLENGQIRQCATSVTGELMMAVQQHTILKNNLVPPADMKPRIEDVRRGLEIADGSGFGHALFSSRVMHVMEEWDKQAATGLFLGAMLSLDLAMLANLITPHTKQLVLYGKALFPSIFEPIIKELYPHMSVTVVSEQLSDHLSAKGAVTLYRKFQEVKPL